MLDIHRPEATSDTKIYFTHSILQTYIDPQNVSTKKQPFVAFNKQHFSHTLDLILPEEIYLVVQQRLQDFTPHYARVHLSLSDILAPEFLSTYIKHGNITMLSEGRPLIDNCFSLFEGKLRLEMNKQTYERCGLQGTPIEDGGKKHQKQRWVVEYDLRQSRMRHGKGAFGRLEWACKNVLTNRLTWLFYNHNPSSAESLVEGKEELSKHAPFIHNISPLATKLEALLVPRLSPEVRTELYDQDASLELLEYLHLISLHSPRIAASDSVDPYISRYEIPDFGAGTSKRDFTCLRWKGFMPPAFVREVFLAMKKVGFAGMGKGKVNGAVIGDGDMNMDAAEGEKDKEKEEERWFVMSAQGFGGKNSWTVMQYEGRETLVWEVEG